MVICSPKQPLKHCNFSNTKYWWLIKGRLGALRVCKCLLVLTGDESREESSNFSPPKTQKQMQRPNYSEERCTETDHPSQMSKHCSVTPGKILFLYLWPWKGTIWTELMTALSLVSCTSLCHRTQHWTVPRGDVGPADEAFQSLGQGVSLVCYPAHYMEFFWEAQTQARHLCPYQNWSSKELGSRTNQTLPGK